VFVYSLVLFYLKFWCIALIFEMQLVINVSGFEVQNCADKNRKENKNLIFCKC